MELTDQRQFLISYDYTNDKEVRFIPKDKPLGGTTAYLTIKEMASLSTTTNDAAVVLMTYYMRKVKTPKFDFYDDAAVAQSLSWSQSKTKKTRLTLVNSGWLKRVTFIQPTTKAKVTIYYVGKEMCDLISSVEEYSHYQANKDKLLAAFAHLNPQSIEDLFTKVSIDDINKAISDSL